MHLRSMKHHEDKLERKKDFMVTRETVPHEDHHQLAKAAKQVIPSDVLNPAELFGRLKLAGKNKVIKPYWQTFIHAILAGFYVGFGGLMSLFMSGNANVNGPTDHWVVVARFFFGMVRAIFRVQFDAKFPIP